MLKSDLNITFCTNIYTKVIWTVVYVDFVFFFVCLKDNPEPTKCLGIFGLSLYTQERDLREVFGRFGPLEDVQVVYDRQVSLSLSIRMEWFVNLKQGDNKR